MASRSVFDYRDYKDFFREFADAQPRGFRKAMAEAAKCQTAYVTHVLAGGAHFSWEQAEGIARFMELSREETQYLLLLVEFTRAGTSSLRSLLTKQLDEMREKYFTVQQRVGIKETLTREDQAVYYSAWYYAAIHMMLTIPELQTKEAMVRHLGLPVSRVGEALDFLVSVGLAERAAGGRYITGRALIHLERESPMISKHHTNWRMQAVRALERGRDDEVHYSTVFSLSTEDVLRVRALLMREIEQLATIVKVSKEEKLFSVCLDFFEV